MLNNYKKIIQSILFVFLAFALSQKVSAEEIISNTEVDIDLKVAPKPSSIPFLNNPHLTSLTATLEQLTLTGTFLRPTDIELLIYNENGNTLFRTLPRGTVVYEGDPLGSTPGKWSYTTMHGLGVGKYRVEVYLWDNYGNRNGPSEKHVFEVTANNNDNKTSDNKKNSDSSINNVTTNTENTTTSNVVQRVTRTIREAVEKVGEVLGLGTDKEGTDSAALSDVNNKNNKNSLNSDAMKPGIGSVLGDFIQKNGWWLASGLALLLLLLLIIILYKKKKEEEEEQEKGRQAAQRRRHRA